MVLQIVRFLLRNAEIEVKLEPGHLTVVLAWNGSVLFEYRWNIAMARLAEQWIARRRIRQ